MRWSIGRCSSPRQYAPATVSSLNAAICPVRSTCGPSHRSVNAPWRYSEIASSSGMSSMISCLNGWLWKSSLASPRSSSDRTKAVSAAMRSRISASMRPRSSGVNGCDTPKS